MANVSQEAPTAMQLSNADTTPLGPYRVLDLTEGGYNWCGRVLADLGADVIKVEPPGGSPTRLRGPFFQDQRHPERSLYWFAYCLNKRGITLDLEAGDGRDHLRALAATADILLESFQPGCLAGLGLGYDDLAKINPGLVYTSITPFGQTGPRAHYQATDMTLWAMGGMQYLCGDEDRPPVRVSLPQAELNAAAQGAAGSLVALWERTRSGRGQHVDVSTQAAVIWTTMNASSHPPLHQENLERSGAVRTMGHLENRTMFACKDGYVTAVISGGIVGGTSMQRLTEWMDGEGCAAQFMKDTDWPAQDVAALTMMLPDSKESREYHEMQRLVERFFSTKTKQQIFDKAVSDGILVAPCNTVQDISESRQLKARKYWESVAHPELGVSITYPGAYVKLTETPIEIRGRPPLAGEHNEEILGGLKPVEPKAEASPPSASDTPAFEGLRVLDMSWVGVGPITMKYLADHGATVIRVESYSRADPARSVAPFKDMKAGFNRSQFPANFNTNKLGLGLNMRRPESVALVKRIIRDWRPDVIAESFTPGSMAKWGLDYQEVIKLKPDVVYFSTCQLGQTGPDAAFGGYGNQAAGMAGFNYLTGWPDREPVAVYGAYTDFINPPNAIAAVIGALEYRRRTGMGQHVDLSQYECAVQFLAPAVLDYHVNGRAAGRRGNRDDLFCPHGVYPCADPPEGLVKGGRWLAIAVRSEAEWEGLKGLLGHPAWAEDPGFATVDGRREREDELDRRLAEWTSPQEAYALMSRLQGAGIPAGVVQAASDLWEDPQLRHRGYFRWLEHKECGPMPYDGPQFLLSRTPAQHKTAAPTVGQHNERVLGDIIGLSSDEIADLYAAEALETSY